MSKTILISGSSRGIGAAIARYAKQKGYTVILHGHTETESLTALAQELNAQYITCDVSNETDVQKAVVGFSIDILVNSAGINRSQTFEKQSTEDWIRTFNVNVIGSVNFSKAVLPNMKKNHYGRIINIASIKGYQHTAGSPAYSASKAAIINLTTSMAKELAPDILINGVAPGFTKTEMTEKSWSDRIKKQVESIPLKRMAEPVEIAQAVLFLAEANYITGQTIIVDGGFYIKNE